MTDRSLVLGTAVGYDYRRIAPFVRSLRATGYRGGITLVVGAVEGFTRRLFARHDVTTVRSDDPDVRRAGLSSTPAASSNEMPRVDIQTSRYILYRGYLALLAAPPNDVLLTDVRDVVFQSDPFKHPREPDALCCAVEHRTIEEDEYNCLWIRTAFGEEALTALRSQLILCSGTTLGSSGRIEAYLEAMVRLIVERPHPIRGVDQGLHNHLIRGGTLAGVRLCTNDVGPFLTMHGLEEWELTAAGEIRGPGGILPPIVHQFDRHPTLKRFVKRRYGPSWLQAKVLRYLRRRKRAGR